MIIYSGESALLNARVPVEIFDRLNAKAKALGITRSTLIRSILEMTFLSPDELRARLDRERAIQTWIRNGCPDPDPSAKLDQ